MRSHLFRINGTWYFRYVLPEKLVTALQVHQYREIRLSLYSTNHVYARELANAYWLACRELVHSDLQALSIVNVDDFKSHVRRSVMSHLPQKFTPLIELIGTTETYKLVAAVKTLSAFNVVFFVLPPPTIKGTISKKVPHGTSWDWVKLASVNGQQLAHMHLPTHMLQDALTSGQDWIEPDYLFNTVNNEEQMLRITVAWRVGFHQLFVSADLPQHIYTAVRKLTDTPSPALTTGTVSARPSTLLSKEIETYCAYKKNAWISKSQSEFAMHLRVFVEMVTDKEILQLTSKDYDFYIQNLPRWPKNCSKNKLYKGKTAREIASMPDPEETISRKTLETYYTTVTGFIRWAADRDENAGMNTSILRMKPQSNQPESDGYVALTDQHLSLIFESEVSLHFLQQSKHPYQKWLPPLGLILGGSRLDELCSLKVEQVGVENGIHYIEIRKGKTKNSVRKVPIHPVLIELGFLKFCEHKKSLGEDRLFPECTHVEKHGHRKAASRWFGEYLDHLGITDKKYVFHSFRHNVSNILNEVDSLKAWRICRYFGHAAPPGASESERSYFKQKKLEHLLPVIKALQFPIDWTKYKQVTAQTYIE